MKKGLALLLTLMLCIGLFSGVQASTFSDVDEEHRHFQAITYLTEKGVINGYEDGSFKPEDTITRAEFVKMLMEFLEITNVYDGTAVKTGFTDVDGKEMTITSKDEAGKETTTTNVTGQHWAAGYIKLAVDKGVVNGYGDGTFLPDAEVKYEEAIKMIVCALGREVHAKTRAENLKISLWPDAYLSIGNDLMISKSTDHMLGTAATRTNVAQMFYNVKDVDVLIQSNVNINDGSNSTKPSFGGGGGGGGGGGTGGPVPPTAPTIPTPTPGSGVTDSTTQVSGLIVYGTVVAAVKQTNGIKKPIIIDNGIVIDNTLVDTVGNNYIIMKLETPIETNNYQQFHTGGNDFSAYLGHRIEMKYRYNPDGGVGGRYEIENVSVTDTDTVYIDSKDFKRDKTTEKNLTSSNVYVCYTDGERDYEQCLYTDDLDTLKVIYNNALINVEELRDQYLLDNPSYSGERSDIDIITIADLMPDNGKLTIVDANVDSTIDLVWVEAYETYVVGDRSFDTTPKSITDKFRTTGSGQALRLYMSETAGLEDALNVMYNGEEIEVTDITKNSILTVAQSKCGKYTDVVMQRGSPVSIILNSVRSANGVKKSFVAKTGTTYNLNDYYVRYVDSTLDYETGDSLTLYVNSMNEVVWATVAEPTYNTGYLVRASYNETTEKITLRILSSSGSIAAYTMADNNTKFVTKATSCLSGVTPNSVSNPNGYLYKNLDESLIYQALLENATTINAGKPNDYKINATTSQPIRYTLASGSEISNLLTVEPDSANLFTGESLKYEKDANTGRLTFTTADSSRSFSAATNATVIFVPDNRDSEYNSFKIGTASSLSTKLVEYMQYNIEPYFVTSSAGDSSRSVFVVYNQQIDALPTYRSDNMVVSNIDDTSTATTTSFTVKGYVASNSSTKTYTCYSEWILNNAFVLDENFNRTGERRPIEVGDVIRVGVTPIGAIANIEIIFDISADKKSEAPKVMAVSNESEQLPIPPNKNYVYYYARLGEITAIDASDTPEFCTITMNDSVQSTVNIGPGYNTRQILLFDHTATDEPATEKDDRLKTVTMDNLWGGEMLFVWQGQNLLYKQIYAVRYPATVTPPVTP